MCLLKTSGVRRCTTENIAPPLWQPAGGHGEVLLEREPRERRAKTNENSGLHEEGLLERLGPKTSITWLFSRRLRREGVLERLGHMRGLASPVPRVGLAPLPDALDMGGTAEGIMVVGVLEPTAVTGRVAGRAARWLCTGALAPGAAGVGIKETLAVLTLARGEWTSHWPASPQANARHIAAWTEANREDNVGGERPKKIQEADQDHIFWTKKERPNLQF